MGRVFDALVKFLKDDSWKFTPRPNEGIVTLGFGGKNGQWDCAAMVKEEMGLIVFYSISPLKIEERKRPAVAEFLHRANYGLFIGNFEFDFTDGEVRFKTSLSARDALLTNEHVRPLIYINVAMMDKYLPGILDVAHGGATPADAVRKVESG